jgi:hypothetical protein
MAVRSQPSVKTNLGFDSGIEKAARQTRGLSTLGGVLTDTGNLPAAA